MYEEVIVGEITAGEAEKTRKELEGLISNWNRSTLDIGFLLHKIKKGGFYKSYGFNTFLEFVNELDIKKRKAQYLTRIVDTMEELNIPRDEFEKVGVAKLREITSLDLYDQDGDPALYEEANGETHLISDVIKGLLVKAPSMDLNEIKEYVKVVKGFVGDNDVAWINICVNRAALDGTINPALLLAKKNLGSSHKDEEGVSQDYSDGKALEVISVEYLQDPANQFLGEK
jgi:hypothetical protein